MGTTFDWQSWHVSFSINAFQCGAGRTAIVRNGNSDMANARIFLKFDACNCQVRPLAQFSLANSAANGGIRIASLAAGTNLHDGLSLKLKIT
jgi:hypothetical protein